jgi:hypothetical protein
MARPPLTHHEILSLVEPFSRSGRQVDLAATDRTARKLAFKPREITEDSVLGQAAGPLVETLLLACWDEDHFDLIRTLQHPGGLRATLEASGSKPGELLAQIDAVPPAAQFTASPGLLVARSYEVHRDGSVDAIEGSGVKLLMVLGEVQLDALTLRLAVRPSKGIPGDITLLAAAGQALELPEDLLAVQGWDWARLIKRSADWNSKLRLRGGLARRSRTARAALDRAAAHLQQVFEATPDDFHERFYWHRWSVVFRRAIPSLTIVFLVVGALLLPRFTDPGNTGLWLALQYVPIAALALSFTLQELPQFEIPPLPRRARTGRWGPSVQLAPADTIADRT